ncbi:MAG: hypothetical protein HS115_06510 [Spirochaetales bacterium]|nr:hypothetical protein [Spirochaetales bacterium]
MNADPQEIQKLVKYIRQMEGIIKTSPSREQRERVSKELQKYREKLSSLIPGSNPARLNLDEIERGTGGAPAAAETPKAGTESSPGFAAGHSILDRFPVEKASAHSTDADINFLSTMLGVLQREYWPVLTDQQCKLDFSCASDRDSIRYKLDGCLRSQTILIETIEEYAGAEKQDFREQLLKMKNKQTRLFLLETNDTLKELRGLLRKINEDLRGGGGMVLNSESTIRFNARFDQGTVLEGRRLPDALLEFEQFVNEVITRLNLPDLKS